MEAKTIQERLKNALMVTEEVADTREVKTIAAVDFRMVGFSLSGKDYGIDIMNVKEIAKAGQFTYVPNTLPFVLGVYNLRGDIIPILDLRLFFNISVPERKDNTLQNLLILTVGEQTFGVVVDKIDKVVGVQSSKIQPPHPLFGDINIKYISGVVEADKHLYILLDIAKIFNSRVGEEDKERTYAKQVFQQPLSVKQSAPQQKAPAATKTEKTTAPAEEKKEEKSVTETSEHDLKFIIESLYMYRKFTVTTLNEQWVRSRFSAWCKERGSGKTQLQNEDDADAFLRPFWSQYTGKWWSQAFADAVYKILPENSAKQIFVWNPGCGKGMESYALACVLRKKYPAAYLRIYAQDTDLLNVSNAPLLAAPPEAATSWYAPFVTKKANGECTFTQNIKDSIMFEYHDCQNTNALPSIDIIFARDVLSLLSKSGQETVVADFDEKIKGNGIIVIGENELLPPSSGFVEKTVGTLKVYMKK
ncbi:MAG: chemotaxis protein CheW [Treponema sp.]|nr:chemotaxis protein CheW [Treponema sp.]